MKVGIGCRQVTLLTTAGTVTAAPEKSLIVLVAWDEGVTAFCVVQPAAMTRQHQCHHYKDTNNFTIKFHHRYLTDNISYNAKRAAASRSLHDMTMAARLGTGPFILI